MLMGFFFYARRMYKWENICLQVLRASLLLFFGDLSVSSSVCFCCPPVAKENSTFNMTEVSKVLSIP